MAFLTSGYRTDRAGAINEAVFTQNTNSMVIVKNVECYSLCEHHLLPSTKPPARSSSRWSAIAPCERTSDDDIDGGIMMTVGQGAQVGRNSPGQPFGDVEELVQP